MHFILTYLWQLLLIAFIVAIAASYIMGKQAKHFFYLRDTVVLHFSIFDLEFPGKPETIKNILLGIDELAAKPGFIETLYDSPEPVKISYKELAENSKKALKNNLLYDFIFMAGVYPFIALLCINTANRMTYWGLYIFLGFAVLQLTAWLFDILENLYLLKELKSPGALAALHTVYKKIVMAKWIFAVTGLVCALFALLYFWLHGRYGQTFMYGVLGIYFLVLAFVIIKILVSVFKTDSKPQPSQ